MTTDRASALQAAGITEDDLRLYRNTIAHCWIVCGLLIELPLEALETLTARAETIGPALHPEIWRKNAKAIMEDREMIRALVTAQRDIMTTSPSLVALAPIITVQADESRARLSAAFREVFSRRDLANVSPAAVLTALVRFIADRVHDVKEEARR